MKIQELQLLTNDLRETKDFYADIIGFEIIMSGDKFISFKAGSTVLSFIYSEVINPVYHFAFNIPSNKLEEAFVWTRKRVHTIAISGAEHVADFSSWNAKAFYFFDNNGNILEFIARFDLDNAIDREFDVSAIQSVSEIGIVAENVEEETTKLKQEFGLELITNPTDQFAAIGNNDGLFILVKDGRDWFPTNVQAARFWLKAIVSSDHEIKELVRNNDIHT